MMRSVWKRDDVTLSAKWKSNSGRVTAYELLSRDDAHALREGETAPLLLPGQLKENDPRYSTEWIEAASRPLFYTGVKVVPTPKSHAVVVRVTGSDALVRVVYQVSSPAGKSDDILTLSPWEASFTLPDDATVTLSGGPYKTSDPKTLDPKPFQMKLEIVADGKVVASATSTGSAASCNYEL